VGLVGEDLLNQSGQHVPRPDLNEDSRTCAVHRLHLIGKPNGGDQMLCQQGSDPLWFVGVRGGGGVREYR
jgi:hypothetical protein